MLQIRPINIQVRLQATRDAASCGKQIAIPLQIHLRSSRAFQISRFCQVKLTATDIPCWVCREQWAPCESERSFSMLQRHNTASFFSSYGRHWAPSRLFSCTMLEKVRKRFGRNEWLTDASWILNPSALLGPSPYTAPAESTVHPTIHRISV